MQKAKRNKEASNKIPKCIHIKIAGILQCEYGILSLLFKKRNQSRQTVFLEKTQKSAFKH